MSRTEDYGSNIARAAQCVRYKTSGRYIARANEVFHEVPLAGMRLLDIGCGRGAWSMWAGLNGAEYVLGIEPEADGATFGTFAEFLQTAKQLSIDHIVHGRNVTFQDLVITEPFDIVVAYNVINHFSEKHVRRLDQRDSRQFYLDVFADIHAALKPGGIFIVADGARRNVWGDLSLKNPLAPSINWEIHASPHTWVEIMEQVGFRKLRLIWSFMYPLTQFHPSGLLAYFLVSHYLLHMQKPR